MRFSFIVPEAHLELSGVSKFHLVLSYYYLRSRPYQEYYKQAKKEGAYIILDNGFHEHGRIWSDDWRVLLPIANDLNPDVIVVPERADADFNLLLENLSFIEFIRKEITTDWEFMYVLRGQWFSELAEELEFLRANDTEKAITWIGLHKDMERFAKGNTGGRRAIALGLQDLLEGYKIHMLGIYKDPVAEMDTFLDLPDVMSSDSAKPWRMCSRGRLITEAKPFPQSFDFHNDRVGKGTLEFVAGQFKHFLAEYCGNSS